MKLLLRIVCVLALVNTHSALADELDTVASEQAIIKGFAKWQASRVERLILDEAISDIAKNQYVQRFFTDTTNNIQLYSGVSSKRLIPLMQYYIKEDIKRFRESIETCIPANVKRWGDNPALASTEAESLFNALTKLSARVNKNSESYTMTDFNNSVCGKDPKKDLGIKVVGTNSYFLKNDKALIERDGSGNITSTKVADVANKIIAGTNPNFRKLLDPLMSDTLAKSKQPTNYVEAIENFVKFVGELKSVGNDQELYSIRIHQMILLIETFGGESKDFSGYSRLKSISLFFGALADASISGEGAADQVAAVLDLYVDDRDAFSNKRAKSGLIVFSSVAKYDAATNSVKETQFWKLGVNRDILFVSSYFGFSYAEVTNEIEGGRGWDGRAFGPVGVELKIGSSNNGVFSFNYAPFDVGNYVTNELSGDEYDAKFEDIYSPSYFFSWTMNRKPLAFLAGYQTGIKYGNNLETEGPFIAVTFDLPIFTLY